MTDLPSHPAAPPTRGMRYLTILLAMGCVVGPAVASAKDKMSNADQARITMRDFSTCLVKSRSSVRVKAVDAFLALSPMSEPGKQAGARLATPYCLSSRDPGQYVSRLRFSAELLRGALFIAKFRREFTGKATPAFKPYAADESLHIVGDDGFLVLQAIGECVVRADALDARTVIEVEVGTPEEDRAFKAMVEPLQNCMPSKGTYRFSRAVLEGLLAEALYNLSVDWATAAPLPVEPK